MWKSLAIVLFAASSFGIGGSIASCFAAEDANPKAAASPEVKPPQPSQRMMHRQQQVNTYDQRQSDADKDTAPDQDTAEDQAPVQNQPESMPQEMSDPGTTKRP